MHRQKGHCRHRPPHPPPPLPTNPSINESINQQTNQSIKRRQADARKKAEGSLADGLWHHLAVVYQAEKSLLRLYVDENYVEAEMPQMARHWLREATAQKNDTTLCPLPGPRLWSRTRAKERDVAAESENDVIGREFQAKIAQTVPSASQWPPLVLGFGVPGQLNSEELSGFKGDLRSPRFASGVGSWERSLILPPTQNVRTNTHHSLTHSLIDSFIYSFTHPKSLAVKRSSAKHSL